MDVKRSKDRKTKLREDLIILFLILSAISFLLYLVILQVTRLQLYTDLFFYISILAILGWWGICYAIYLLIKNKHKKNTAEIVRTIEIIIGIIYSYGLGLFLGYKALLLLMYLIVPGLWVAAACISEIVRIIRGGYES
jgi:hypothetical protein